MMLRSSLVLALVLVPSPAEAAPTGTITIVSGNNQNQLLLTPPGVGGYAPSTFGFQGMTVKLTGADGKPMVGQLMEFTARPGNAGAVCTIVPQASPLPVTDVNGQISTRLTMQTMIAGSCIVTARNANMASNTVDFVLTVSAAVPTPPPDAILTTLNPSVPVGFIAEGKVKFAPIQVKLAEPKGKPLGGKAIAFTVASPANGKCAFDDTKETHTTATTDERGAAAATVQATGITSGEACVVTVSVSSGVKLVNAPLVMTLVAKAK